MRLIDADELMDYERMAMAEYIKRGDALRILEDGEYWPIGKLYDDILHLPAADVVEARYGKWIDADKQLPNTDKLVLVIVDGKPCKNIELIDAYEFAAYSSAEGWIIEAYPLWEKAHVSYWMPLPEPPKGADNETD